MKLYSEGKNYKLFHGNMLDMGEIIEPNSIDAVVTDPPYELGFMNKGWDSSGIAFQKETWEKCFTALKPGGYLLAFGGSRTYHRIACAIEDAGFEIRDTIQWIYGCYSSDTQVLTDRGWKYFYELDKTEKILQWDKDTNKLSWLNPLNYFEYDVDTEMCLFENRHISQLVTPNHKVAVSVKQRRKDFVPYELIEAQDIKKSWILNFPLAGNLDGTIHEKDAYIIGWWFTDAWRHKDGKACMFSQAKTKTLSKLKNYFDTNNIKYSEYIKSHTSSKHQDEHIFYVTGIIANKLLSEYPDRRLTWEVLNWDKESRLALLEGLMDGDGSCRDKEYSMIFWSQNKERCDIFQALCISLNYRAYIYNKRGIVSGVVFNTAHNSTQTQTRHHKANIHYTGKVYCLETEKGAFVVRRNGKAFISGNSGFPKSMNLSLAIDKKMGIESELGDVKQGHEDFVGRTTNGDTRFEGGMEGFDRPWMHDDEKREAYHYEKLPTSDEAKQWKGWGTSLKPSYEPIIIARKPCEGSCIDNVIKYGVGGINIDECRIPFQSDADYAITANKNQHEKFGTKPMTNNTVYGDYSMVQPKNYESEGRFPSNVILTYDEDTKDEVCGGMPDVGSGNGGTPYSYAGKEYNNRDTSMFNGDKPQSPSNYNDSGSASRYFMNFSYTEDDLDIWDTLPDVEPARYFYCAKASQDDRNSGLEKFDSEQDIGKNIHPTVKPCDLMNYLIRLVTPKGGTVLDPFNGSGSTGKACMLESLDHNKDYKYIGIELTDEYLPISEARISYAVKHTSGKNRRLF